MSPLLFTLACALGIAACIGWIAEVRRARRELDTAAGLLHRAQLREAEANTRAHRAEFACEELRASLMRGSAVAKFTRPTPAPNADDHYWHVLTTRGRLETAAPALIKYQMNIRSHFLGMIGAALIACAILSVPGCVSGAGGKKHPQEDLSAKPPTPAETKGVVASHHQREQVQFQAAERINVLTADTEVAEPVREQTAKIVQANKDASAAEIEAMFSSFTQAVSALESARKVDKETIKALKADNEKLRTDLAAEKENFAKSVRKWIVAGCYTVAVVCVLLAALRFKAALTTGLAPLAALKSGAFLLGLAGTLISLAKVVGAWWFEYACYAVGAAVVGWIGYTLWREQRLEQSARAAKVVVKRLDAAYENVAEDTKVALDRQVFEPLSAEMNAVPGAKQAIHLLRAAKS